MNLAFYSGGDDEDNFEMDKEMIRLGGGVKQITFIPSDSYDGEYEYFHFVKRFKRHGVQKFFYFPIDIPFSDIIKEEALTSDAIFLGGGNTFYFLKYLKEKNLLEDLREFARQEGVIAGESAGAIIMSPNIKTAGFPSFDRDENDVGLKNMKSLDLAKFEFFPHFKNSKRYELELSQYSQTVKNPIVACKDGGGVVVDQEKISFFGRTLIYFQGKVIKSLV